LEKRLSHLFGLNHNALVISITELIHDSGSHLIWSFWSLYVLKLGGSIEILGLFTLLTGISSIILHPILGFISDRIGRKKPVVIGGFIVSLFPLILAFADNWIWLIPGILLRAMDNGLWTTRQALFTDNIEINKKGRSIAIFYTVMGLTSSFLPAIGGVLLDRMGVVQGFRIGLFLSSATLLIQSIVNAKYLQESNREENRTQPRFQLAELRLFIKELIEPLKHNKKFQTLLIGQGILSFGNGLISQFTILYAVEIIGLSKTEWGLISSFSSFVNMIFRIPIGSFVDRIGNLRGYLIGILIQSLYPVLFFYSQFFLYVLLFNTINTLGSTFTQMSRESLLIEIMPKEERGILYGSFAAISGFGGVFGSTSPIIGAYLWNNFGPIYNFYSTTALSLLAFIYYIKTLASKDNAK
jgi:MFS transporter, DHA1 family, multidrug resistance protein